MSELSFRTHGFASLASGTYLFFPVPSSDLDRRAELRALSGPANPQRVVLVTNPEASGAPSFSGVGSGNTLYVVLAPEEFEKVLASVRNSGRDGLESPVKFQFELDAQDELLKLAIDGKALTGQSYVNELAPAGKASEKVPDSRTG